MGKGSRFGVLFFCSLSGLNLAAGAPPTDARGTDPEKQEFKMAVERLRKENTDLRKIEATRQRELAAATNRLALIERKLETARSGLAADDEDARISAEWRSLLVKALKALNDSDQELRGLQKRLDLLVYASKEAFKSAEKVDPDKRSLLEGEIRQSDKALAGRRESRPAALIGDSDNAALTGARIIGAQLELGVAALSVGRRQGARVGMPFLALRGKAVLAVLTLVEVREKTSLALIEQMDSERPIREGDAAVLRRTTR